MSKKFIPGLILGALVGAGAALLFAPKSGKELREDLADKSEDLKAIALDYMELLTVKSEELLNATKETTSSLTQTLNEKKEEVVEKVSALKDTVVEEVSKLTSQEA